VHLPRLWNIFNFLSLHTPPPVQTVHDKNLPQRTTVLPRPIELNRSPHISHLQDQTTLLNVVTPLDNTNHSRHTPLPKDGMQLPKTQSIFPLFLLAVLLFSRSTYCLSGGYQGFTVRREAFVEPGPNLPIFQIQENSPEFPTEEHAGIWRRLGVAFNDMLIMAGFACATFNPLETVYKRYFGEQGGSHPALVRCK